MSVILHVSDDDRATVLLFADRKRIGSGALAAVANHLSFWGIDVGYDGGARVSNAYPGRFAMDQGALSMIDLQFFEDASAEDIAARMEATE